MPDSPHPPTQDNKYYWQSSAALAAGAAAGDTQHEFAERLPVGQDATEPWLPSRRDFLKLMGFSVATASLAACEAPVRKAIPYLVKPEEIDPGVANWFATTYQLGTTCCGLIVKTREGRPIKVTGNPQDVLSQGGVSPQIEASVLSLYDNARFRGPQHAGKPISWQALDEAVSKGLSAAAAEKKPIVLISRSIVSPSTQAALAVFAARYPSTQHVVYDNPSYSATLDVYKAHFGLRALPFFDFAQSRCTVSFSADFLGSYLSPTLFSRQFAQLRKVNREKRTMSKLFVFESNLSLTGANADYRVTIGPQEEAAYLANLYNRIAEEVGADSITAPDIPQRSALEQAAKALLGAKGASLVLSGQNDYGVQRICCAINHLLKNYGKTLRLDKPLYVAEGDDKAFGRAIQAVKKGDVGAVIFYACNPVYEHPQGAALAEALAEVPLTLSTSSAPDETSATTQYVAPTHHYLEAWNDAAPVHGQLNLSQPTISPLFRTRQSQSSLLAWSGEDPDYFGFLQNQWRIRYDADGAGGTDFQTFFDKCLHDGVLIGATTRSKGTFTSYQGNLHGLRITSPKTDGLLRIVPYFSVSIGAGEEAGNPWLQELPDPISKLCWENAVSVAPSDAKRIGISTEENTTSLVRLKVGTRHLELPALVQPGQAPGTLGLALGYGRRVSNKVGQNRGVDLYPLLDYTSAGYVGYSVADTVEIAVIGRRPIALMQTQNTYMGRQTIIQETTLSRYQKDEDAGRFHPKITTPQGKKSPGTVSLWEGHKYPNHHWGMVIDLNSCTGCNACVVACQAENNIPVVGQEEVIRRRDMHWLRIDRYYSSEATGTNLEQAADNPEVIFQPMLCQHCNNAPCETVCPVAATSHSSEGLNQMTYNRCIGTRYCANNCPYKVRRFNWFKYHDNDQFAVNTAMYNALGKMALNPDVTVRARGVMEKCSFCVQRIQAGKLTAKRQGRRPVDKDVQTACAVACPTEAITFGDLKDPQSRISQQLRIPADADDVVVGEKRAYQVLEELNVKPNIWYLTKIRNSAKEAPQG